MRDMSTLSASAVRRFCMRILLMFILLAQLYLIHAIPPDPVKLKSELDALTGVKALRSAKLAVAVFTPRDTTLIYSYHSDTLMIPASIQKVLTGVAAYQSYGQEYRFETVLAARGVVRDSTLSGDLVVIGAGDPSLMEELYPDGPELVFEAWADSLLARGVRTVSGNLVINTSRFPTQYFSSEWMEEDRPYGYAPPISAVAFNANMIRFDIVGNIKVGKEPGIVTKNNYGFIDWSSTVKTTSAKTPENLWITRGSKPRQVELKGTVPVMCSTYVRTSVQFPEEYFAHSLREILASKGIAIQGCKEVETSPPDAAMIELFRWRSLPLKDILAIMLKNSSNLIAETMLHNIGPGAQQGGERITEIIRETGIPATGLKIADGSGLSRNNRVSARQMGALLCHAYNQPWGSTFVSNLAIGGVDGTLKKRFTTEAEMGRIMGKTGTMKGISTLAGYIISPDGDVCAFVMMGNSLPSTADARTWQDNLCKAILRAMTPQISSVNEDGNKTRF